MSTPLVSLAADIHLAWVGPDVIALDVAQDRYILLLNAAEALIPAAPGAVRLGDGAARVALEQAGFLDDTPQPPRTPMLQARRAIEPPARPEASLIPWWSSLLDGLLATAAFKRRTFVELVATARSRRPRRGARPTDPALALEQFYAIYPWLPWEGDCLQRAFLLHQHLHRRGLACRWVFGVRAWPFLAHCWVQIDDVVIGDSLSRVGAFTPIMVV